MKKQIHVLIFTKESRGGSGSFLDQLSALGKRSGITLMVYLYKYDDLAKKNLHWICLSKAYPDNPHASLRKVIAFIQNCIKTHVVLSKHQNKTTFTCEMYSSVILLLLKYLIHKKSRIICLINNNYEAIVKSKQGFLYRTILQMTISILYKKANTIIFVSDSLARATIPYLHLEKVHTETIHNGISPFRIRKQSHQTLDDEDLKYMNSDKSKKIISVGRFASQKDFITLIRAFSQVHSKIPHTSLYLIGEGEERGHLEKLTSSLDISQYIHFLGWKHNIYPFLKQAHLFVFSSKYEGFGRVLVEAMVCGLPVVSTDTPFGPSEILGNGTFGSLVPVGDPRALSNEIVRILQDQNVYKQYALASKQRSTFFSEERMLHAYQKLLQAI